MYDFLSICKWRRAGARTRRKVTAVAAVENPRGNEQLLSRRQVDLKGSNIRINCKEIPYIDLDPVSFLFTCCGYTHSSCAKRRFAYVAP